MNKNGLILLLSLSCLPGSLFLHLVSAHLHGVVTPSIVLVARQQQPTSRSDAKVWFQGQGITISVTPNVVATFETDNSPERFVLDASSARLELPQTLNKELDRKGPVRLSPVTHLERMEPRDINQTNLTDQDAPLPEETAVSPIACQKNKQDKRRPLGRLLGI